MNNATTNTDTFFEDASNAVIQLAKNQQTFTVDDVLEVARQRNPLLEDPAPQSLQQVMRAAIANDAVEKTGSTVRSKRTSGPIQVWRSKLYQNSDAQRLENIVTGKALPFVMSLTKEERPYAAAAVAEMIEGLQNAKR